MLTDLLAHPGVIEEVRLQGAVGVMALHGGIEPQTAGIARQIADRSGASLYVVEQPADLAWHVPSTRFDPAESESLASFVAHVSTILSIHGFGRPDLVRTVLVGGRNRPLRARVAAAVRAATEIEVVDDPSRIPPGLRGLHPRNPVNLAGGGGVQIELSHTPRHPPHRRRLVSAVSAVVVEESERDRRVHSATP